MLGGVLRCIPENKRTRRGRRRGAEHILSRKGEGRGKRLEKKELFVDIARMNVCCAFLSWGEGEGRGGLEK